MKVIIAGCGRVGALLATKLSAEGHDVVVIDKDPRSFTRLGKTFTGTTHPRHGVRQGTCSTRRAPTGADAFVAVTSGDNSNVVSATIAREIYRIPKVVARIFDPRRAEIYRRLGIQTVSSVSWATNEIVSLVMLQHLVRDVSSATARCSWSRSPFRPGSAGAPSTTYRARARSCRSPSCARGPSFIPTSHEALHDGDVLEVAVLTVAMPRFESMLNP